MTVCIEEAIKDTKKWFLDIKTKKERENSIKLFYFRCWWVNG